MNGKTLVKFAAFAVFAAVNFASAKEFALDISPEAFKNFQATKYASAVKQDGVDAIKVQVDNPPSKDNFYEVVKIPVELSKTKGKSFALTMKIVAENVKSTFGIDGGSKVYFYYTKDAQNIYFSTRNIKGTSNTETTILVDIIPEDVAAGHLAVGLAGATGTVYYKDIKLMTGKSATYWTPAIDDDFKCEYSDKFKKSPVMRGAMVSTKFNAKDLNDFRKWNGNLVRVSFGGSPGDNRWTFGEKEEAIINAPDYMERYDAWLDERLDEVQKFADEGAKIGVKIVIGLHSTPGFRYQNKDMRMFFEDKYANKFIEVWKKIATRFKGHPGVWCYDLCNEPIQSKPSPRDYLKLQYQAARAIRNVDPEIPISVEAVNWENPRAFKYLKPLPLKDIIYQVHMYDPGDLTHQGVLGPMPKDVIFYPNPAKPHLTKEHIAESMQDVVDFQKKWGARIFVGEFSCVRWSPGRDQYIKDCVDFFEQNGWDWTYHAFREWNGWSVEHGADKNSNAVSKTDTPAKKVLLDAYKKNEFR